MKTEATRPASDNFLHQQARFEAFLDRYNQERPHQALDMKGPWRALRALGPAVSGPGTLDYPFHDWTATVTHCGRICYDRRKINLSQVFAGQRVGVKPESGSSVGRRAAREHGQTRGSPRSGQGLAQGNKGSDRNSSAPLVLFEVIRYPAG